jgi:phosphoenolpyruvate-protein kinase (PTS system EI component)
MKAPPSTDPSTSPVVGDTPSRSSARLALPQPGRAAVEGIAVGLASVWASDPAPRSTAGTLIEERMRLDRAIRWATTGVRELVRLLPRGEAELFEPELAILAELGPALLGQVEAGMRAEDAVNAGASEALVELIVDARARLLDALAQDPRSVAALLEGCEGERVLVTEKLTPSVVASLPARVVGIVAASENAEREDAGCASHAAILARCRDIPLAFVAPHIVRAIAEGERVAIDTTVNPASVWASPSDSLVADAHTRREAWARARAEEEGRVTAPLAHLGLVVLVNIGSLHEHVSAEAEGIGLLRTELVFSHHATAPSEAAQVGAMRVIAARVQPGAPVVVRLFDAGGDKPLPWLRAPNGEARGIELLFLNPAVLDTQLRAIVRAAERADVRVLLPLVTCARDVERVRAKLPSALRIGALIETPDAVERIEEIAAVCEFLSIGTNDLSAAVTGRDRALASLHIDRRVLRMIERVVEAGHARSCPVSVCGELAGDPSSARILVGMGVDALSVATGRLSKVKLALRDVSIEDCRGVAREALNRSDRKGLGAPT